MTERWEFCDEEGAQPTSDELRAAAYRLARMSWRQMAMRLNGAMRHIAQQGDVADGQRWLDLVWMIGEVSPAPRRQAVRRFMRNMEAAGMIRRVDQTKH